MEKVQMLLIFRISVFSLFSQIRYGKEQNPVALNMKAVVTVEK